MEFNIPTDEFGQSYIMKPKNNLINGKQEPPDKPPEKLTKKLSKKASTILLPQSSKSQLNEEIELIVLNELNQKDCFKSFQVQVNEDRQISLHEVVSSLMKKGFALESAMIYYFDAATSVYIYCGKAPDVTNYLIPLDNLNSRQLVIKHKIAKNCNSLLKQLLEEQKLSEDEEKVNSKQKNKRIKERTISDVVQKVALWRKLYYGFYDKDGKLIQLPLDKAAQKIGISKKTLDDYLFQIRLGKKYGFDFNESKAEKIGTLRNFVRQNREKRKKDPKIES